MAAKGCDEFCTTRNPAIDQLGCNFLNVEGYTPVLDLPTGAALGKNRVARPRIAVLGQACRRYVYEHLPAPDAHVRNVQMTERNRLRFFIADQVLEHVFFGIGPEVLVVVA